MSNTKTNIEAIDVDNLIGHLREEVGQVIDSWIILRHFKVVSSRMQTHDIANDIQNPDLNFMNLIKSKLSDDIIARLSELSETKTGRINFYFAGQKLSNLEHEIKEFKNFIENKNFRKRRNQYISHKQIPPRFEDWRGPHRIEYKTLLRGVGMALRLMKKIDNVYLGDISRKQWLIMRKKRYDFNSPRVGTYLLLPYLIDTNYT